MGTLGDIQGAVQQAFGSKAWNLEKAFGSPSQPPPIALPPPITLETHWPSGLYSSYWEGKEEIFDGGNRGGAFLNQTNAYTVPTC